jgi:hypothetical protein
MIANRVTRVTLARTAEDAAADVTGYLGTEVWRVEWTAVHNDTRDVSRHTHYTETAARRHVQGLLDERVPGMSIEDVDSEHL